jgi:hypothetical protein
MRKTAVDLIREDSRRDVPVPVPAPTAWGGRLRIEWEG